MRATFPRIASSPSQIFPVVVVVVATSHLRPTTITRIFTGHSDCCEVCRPTCSLAKRPRAAHAKTPRDSVPRDSSDRDSNAHNFIVRIDRRRDHSELGCSRGFRSAWTLFFFFLQRYLKPEKEEEVRISDVEGRRENQLTDATRDEEFGDADPNRLLVVAPTGKKASR